MAGRTSILQIIIYSITFSLCFLVFYQNEADAVKPPSFEVVTLLDNVLIPGNTAIEVPPINISDFNHISFLVALSGGSGGKILLKFGDAPSFDSTVAQIRVGECDLNNEVRNCRIQGSGSSFFTIVDRFNIVAPYLLAIVSNTSSSGMTITLKAYLTK